MRHERRHRRPVHGVRRLHRNVPGGCAEACAQAADRGRRPLHAVPGVRGGLPPGRDRMTVHPIEAESYRIMAGRIDLSELDGGRRAIVERVIHASADFEYASTMRFDDGAVEAAVDALRKGAPDVADVETVRAGIPGAVCPLPPSAAGASTRSSAGIREAARMHPEG